MSDTPRVSIVVLSHDRPGPLREALASIQRQRLTGAELIVVDNPSPQSPAIDQIVATVPGITFRRPPANLGFAAGMNAGIALARGAYTYLTEDDLVLEDGTVERLVSHLDAHPDVGMVGPAILDQIDRTILYGGGDVTIGGVYRLDMPARGQPSSALPQGPRDSTYLPAGSALVRTDLLRRCGGFRDDFFLYFEDVDICLRIRRAGFRIECLPTARVLHVRPPPGVPSALVAFHKQKNLIALYVMHAPLLTLAEFLLRYVVLQWIRGGAPGERGRIVKAVGWIGANLPSLLRDRRAIRRLAAAI
ncbi:MAG TPA: glycosyltransferase family 2 protein [Gemmatimonadales bacterium]